jgi:thioesterase domain-containing protein
MIFLAYSAGGHLAYEVIKKMQHLGVLVDDLILVDAFRDTRTKHTREKDEDINKRPIFEMLEKNGLGYLRGKVFNIIKTYSEFGTFQQNDKTIKTAIHFIKSPLNPGINESIQEWRAATTGPVLVYEGYGEHDDMFSGQHIRKNAVLINTILSNCYYASVQ